MSTLKSPLSRGSDAPHVHQRLRKHLARCTLDCGFKTSESPALRGFVAERGPVRGTSLYLVLKSNGPHRSKNPPVKFGFSLKPFPQILPKSYRYNSVPNRFSSHFSASRTNGPRSLSRVKAGTHSAFGEGSHTAAYTPKQGPSLPRPQHGLVPSAKFLLVLHAFIYIHFPVHCEPSTPAEEKNLSKLLSQTLSQTIFHRVFQLLPQTAHVRFHSRKRVHTLAFANRIAHNGTHSETGGVSDGGAIITLDTSCTFTNIPGPGVRPAYFAAFGS